MVFFSNIFSRSQPSGRTNSNDFDESFARLEEKLEARANALIEEWERDAGAALNQSVSSLLNSVFDSLGSQLGAKSAAPKVDLGEILGASGGVDQALRPLENQVNRWIKSTVDDWFSSEKTTVSSSQSTRSNEALEKFRQSRSQHNAQAAQESAQGQRNL